MPTDPYVPNHPSFVPQHAGLPDPVVPPSHNGKAHGVTEGGLRKRGEIRAEKFLEAATLVLLEKGYRDTRLADIVAHAGGSLSTLYRAFGDKEGMARAIMEKSIRSFDEILQTLRQSNLPPEQALPAAAESMVAEILKPGRIVAHRIVIAEGLSAPELRDWFYEHGIQPTEKVLTEYFEREKRIGSLLIESPTDASSKFYLMIFGGLIMRTVNGRILAEDLPVVQAEVRNAVSIFLHGILPHRSV